MNDMTCPELDAQGDQMFGALMKGETIRSIAKRHSTTVRVVQAECTKRLHSLDEDALAFTMRKHLTYMDGLMTTFYRRSIEHEDVHAGMLCTKISETVMDIIGRDRRPQSVNLLVQEVPKLNTTERITEILATAGVFAGPPSEPPPDAA